MLIAQHPLFTPSPGEVLLFVLIVLLFVLINLAIHLAFLVTAMLLLPGKWKWLALPGVLCPLGLLLFFIDVMLHQHFRIITSRSFQVFLVGCIYTAVLAIVAIVYRIVADTGAKRNLSK